MGSTTQILCRRFSNHKTDYNSYVNNGFKGFITSFKIIELGDSYIELLEQINCDTKTQLEMREGELIRIHKDLCINKIIVGRTKQQYRLDNIDKIKQQQRQYKQDNPDKIKQYRLYNADIIKQYRQDNADKRKQYDKQYYLNKKTPKINIAKEDYDLLIHCDKLMNIQYSYKKIIIVE